MVLHLLACDPKPPVREADREVTEALAAAPPLELTPLPGVGDRDAWDEDLAALRAEMGPWSTDAFVSAHTPPPSPPLDHDPGSARYLDDIVKKLGLTENERKRIATTGLVVTRPPRGGGSYAELYRGIYGRDLPVLITLESVWFAYQVSYADALRAVETHVVKERLLAAITRLQKAGPKNPDVDVYLAVAAALGTTREWRGPPVVPIPSDPADEAEVFRVFRLAQVGEDVIAPLYGRERHLPLSRVPGDGSPDTPPELTAMMGWLQAGRFVLVEDGEGIPRETEAALALADLVDRSGARADLEHIDALLTALVGPAEGLGPLDLAGWRPGEGDVSAALAAEFSDRNRIRSEQSFTQPQSRPRPIALTFSLVPTRFTPDAHVFTNVTADRVPGRRFPSPLDLLAVLGADAATPLLDLGDTYATQLEALRRAQDSMPKSWWEEDIHRRWLGVIRASNQPDPRRPAVFESEAGRRRLLQTQLVAWTWLRADHAIFAEEASEEGACSFPDVYVDPYPEAWRGLAELARESGRIFREAGVRTGPFERIAKEADGLASASESLLATGHVDEKTGRHLSAFIVSPLVYGEFNYSGWYPELFARGEYLTVPEVQTRVFRGVLPVGAPESLSVRADAPALMVVTVKTGHGPTAFVGPVQTFRTYTGPGVPEAPNRWDPDPEPNPWLEPGWLAELRAEPSGTWEIPRKDKFTEVEESGME